MTVSSLQALKVSCFIDFTYTLLLNKEDEFINQSVESWWFSLPSSFWDMKLNKDT